MTKALICIFDEKNYIYYIFCDGSKLDKLNSNLTQFIYKDGMPINLSYPSLMPIKMGCQSILEWVNHMVLEYTLGIYVCQRNWITQILDWLSYAPRIWLEV